MGLLEVERQDNHVAVASVDGLCVLHQRAVDEVATVLLDDIEQAEAKLQFGDELEERQVDVASHAHLKVEVEGLEPQGIVFAGREVHHRIDAGYEVRAEVVVARGGELQVDGYGDVGALEDLRTVGTAFLLVIDSMLLPEVNRGRKAKGQVIVQPKGSQHADREAGAVVVNLGIPLLARLGVDISVVLQLDVLHVESEQEAIVKLPLVDVRAVLHLALLCRKAQGKDEYDERGKASEIVSAHQNNNENKVRFIARIIVFGDKEEKKSAFMHLSHQN